MALRSTNVLSLCSGFGGLDLGLRVALPSARTVCYVEREAYCVAGLVARMEEGRLDPGPVWSDVGTFDGKPWRGVVDLVIGGYPCQPFSVAGNRRGEDDPRHLWPHFARIIRECEPQWCFFENVRGHLSKGFEVVTRELCCLGYDITAGLFTAEDSGASHERTRLFTLAYSNRHGLRKLGLEGEHEPRHESPPWNVPNRSSRETMAGVDGFPFPPYPDDVRSWSVVPESAQPNVCRMAHGMADRLDRLRAIGNGVVPAQAAHAYRTLRARFG